MSRPTSVEHTKDPPIASGINGLSKTSSSRPSTSVSAVHFLDSDGNDEPHLPMSVSGDPVDNSTESAPAPQLPDFHPSISDPSPPLIPNKNTLPHLGIIATASSPSQRNGRPLHPGTNRQRPNALIHHGKRASLVTGGYETSSDEDAYRPPGPRGSISLSKSFGGMRQPNGLGIDPPEHSRKRSQTVFHSTLEETNGSGEVSGPSESVDEKRRRKESEGARSSRRISSPPLTPAITTAHSHFRSASSRLHRSLSQAPTLKSDGFFLDTLAGPSRRISSRHQAEVSTVSNGIAGPSTTHSAARSKRDDAVTSPQGSRKGKEKERQNDLASSFGFEAGSKDIALTPEQIHDLLIDVDVASALRLLSSPHPGIPNTASLSPMPSTKPFQPRAAANETPPRPEPYIAYAPPALTTDARTRNRAISVDSSVAATPGRGDRQRSWDTEPKQGDSDRRRRASSRVIMGEDGGHIPFTHHVHAPPVIEDDSDNQMTETPASIPEPEDLHTFPINSVSGKEGLGTRSRLSQLFHLKKKNSHETLLRPFSTTHHIHHSPTQHYIPRSEENRSADPHHAQKAHEKNVRDSEMRRKELERREAELAQERRFRALTQVAAHPDAERNAYRASSHLRAYYNHIYDGIETPPKMNPLAVLRWRHRTAEQVEAKTRWEADHKAKPTWDKNGAVHDSPISVGSSHVDGRVSNESVRPTSFGSSQPYLSPDPSRRENAHRSGWTYTVEDVAAYKVCEGVVNYFIPPRAALTPSPNGNTTMSDTGPSPNQREESTTGSKEKDHVQARITSASAASLVAASSASESKDRMSPGSILVALSPVASYETGGNVFQPVGHRLMHRTHHSLGALGPSSITQALKHPFEKLSSVTKIQQGLHASPVDGDESQEDLSHPEPPTNAPYRPIGHRPSRSTAFPHRDQFGLFRRSGEGSMTDDEHREGHIRKLFRGQQGLPVDERRGLKKSDASSAKQTVDRQAQLLALEIALTRETAFRQRQAEQKHRTQLEEVARARINQLEGDVYAERSQHLVAASKRLEQANDSVACADDDITHFLLQFQQITQTAKISAGVDVKWPDVEGLRRSYAPKSASTARRPSDNRNGSAAESEPSRKTPKRQASMDGLGLYNMGMKPWSRRSTLDPSGTQRVDPIRQTELTIEYARQRQLEMTDLRNNAANEAVAMVDSMRSLISQKDVVRQWAKTALESNRSLQMKVDRLNRQLRGNQSAIWGRRRDWLLDWSWRSFLSPLIKSILGAIYVVRWVWSLQHPRTRMGTGPNERGPSPWGFWSLGLFWLGVGLSVYYLFVGRSQVVNI